MDLKYIDELIINNEISKLEKLIKMLDKKEYEIAIKYLINILSDTEDGNKRNTVACLLGDLKCQLAAEVLFDLIFDSKLENNRGTLIYALGQLQCTQYIHKLLPLLYQGNYEVQMNMHILLQENIDKMKPEQKKISVEFIKNKIGDFENKLDILYDVYENIFNK